MQQKNIISISLISSTTCNLNCSFCYLHKNESYKLYDKIVREHWANGKYIINAYNTVKAFPADPNNVEVCQLWGGETLLNIDDVTKNIQLFYKYFPNVKEWKISTNFLVNIDKFMDFLKEIDNNTKKDTLISLQVSIDGPPGEYCEQGHNGDWEIYKKNFFHLTTLVNNYKFNHIYINITINATVSRELYLKKFSDYNEMKHYVEEMYNLTKYINDNCISRSINMELSYILPGMAQPYDDTTEDGKKFAEICKLWEKLKIECFPDLSYYFGFYNGCGPIIEDRPLFKPNAECTELKSCITINYDGSICECSGSYIDSFKPYQEELKKENRIKDLRAAQRRDKLTYNPAKMTPEELEKHDWYVYYGYKNNSSTYMHLMMCLADELALSGQIPYRYHEDKEYLLKHISALSAINSCTRENLKETGISYLCPPSSLRRYLNGVLDYGYNLKFLKLKKDIEGESYDRPYCK